MVRVALQVLILPLLFALLGAGGNATFCSVLSALGLEAHRHLHHEGEEADHPAAFCLHSHDEAEEHGRPRDTAPCPESCNLRLSEAPAPDLVKVPGLSVAMLAAARFEVRPIAAAEDGVLSAFPDPPDRRPLHSAPAFTGRFLI